jgi:hypothetical protein
MKKDFVTYEQARELKQLGFDEECLGYYTYRGELVRYAHFEGKLDDFQTLKNSSLSMSYNWCTAPTFSQAFRWFRDEYALNSYIRPKSLLRVNKTYQFNIDDNLEDTWYDRYEEAELECLKKLIGIIKNNHSN